MAKKFNFKLDPVLKVRTYKVKEAKEDLGKTISERVKAELEIENRQNYLSNFLKSTTGKISAAELQTQWNHKGFIEGEINDLSEERQKLITIEEKKRIKLDIAMQKEKVITKLKEKRKTEYVEHINKEEVKEMDEIARNMDRMNKGGLKNDT
jgi:flagellar FliJ protein